mmetsp:Transcript_24614/g.47979  ORF Transcript_24614/g.47979 Transcript_24614/m.47979 type:complete len:230 (-) Transcript_24614:597-1286(-)
MPVACGPSAKPAPASEWSLRMEASGRPCWWIGTPLLLTSTIPLTTTQRSFGQVLKPTSRVWGIPRSLHCQADATPARKRLQSGGCLFSLVTHWARFATSRRLQSPSESYLATSTAPSCHTNVPHQCSNVAVLKSNGLLWIQLWQATPNSKLSGGNWQGPSCVRSFSQQRSVELGKYLCPMSSGFSGHCTSWNCLRLHLGIPSSPSCFKIHGFTIFAQSSCKTEDMPLCQ